LTLRKLAEQIATGAWWGDPAWSPRDRADRPVL